MLAGRDPSQARPSVYRESKEVSIDGWILLMRRYPQSTQTKATPDDKAWSIISHLGGVAHKYNINKPSPNGTHLNKHSSCWLVNSELEAIRCKCVKPFHSTTFGKDDWMQYLDALEGLRSDEPVTTKRYEILQCFIEGVRDAALRRDPSITYASETTATAQPTVEYLRLTTR